MIAFVHHVKNMLLLNHILALIFACLLCIVYVHSIYQTHMLHSWEILSVRLVLATFFMGALMVLPWTSTYVNVVLKYWGLKWHSDTCTLWKWCTQIIDVFWSRLNWSFKAASEWTCINGGNLWRLMVIWQLVYYTPRRSNKYVQCC